MTVRELIERLQDCDPDAKVVISDDDGHLDVIWYLNRGSGSFGGCPSGRNYVELQTGEPPDW